MNQNLNNIERKIKIENPQNILNNNQIKTESLSDDIGSGNDLSVSENNEDYRTGRWHPSEHYRFVKGCLLHGNNWKKVFNKIPYFSLIFPTFSLNKLLFLLFRKIKSKFIYF